MAIAPWGGGSAETAQASGGYAPDVPQRVTPFHRLASVVEDVLRTLGRVNGVADRLLGPVPEPATQTQGASGSAGGILNLMDATAGQLAEACGRAQRSLDRIEKALP